MNMCAKVHIHTKKYRMKTFTERSRRLYPKKRRKTTKTIAKANSTSNQAAKYGKIIFVYGCTSYFVDFPQQSTNLIQPDLVILLFRTFSIY